MLSAQRIPKPRPTLTPKTSAVDFLNYYWDKNELISFCRDQKMSTSGSKEELNERSKFF